MDPRATKVVFRRGVAFLIDAIPGFVLYAGLIDAFGQKIREESGTNIVMKTEIINGDVQAQLGDNVYHLTGGDFAIVALLAMAYWIGLYVIVQGLTGATLGKAILAIRTVDIAGRPCGIGRAAVRWLLLIVDGFFYVFPVVGLVAALASDGNRRVGDMAAQTHVVKKSAVGQPVRTSASALPVGPAGAGAPHWDPNHRAYLYWEPLQQIWLRWDDATGRWVPLEANPRPGRLDV